MHIPTDAEEQEAANNKLNEHSYANVRARDKLSDDESKVTEVKVSEYVYVTLVFSFFLILFLAVSQFDLLMFFSFAGVNSSLSGSSKPTGMKNKEDNASKSNREQMQS